MAKSIIGTNPASRSSASAGRLAERMSLALAIGAGLFLVFLAGAAAILFKVFPYRYLNDAYLAYEALYEQEVLYKSPYDTDLWAPQRTSARGVVKADPMRAQPGFTLYTSAHKQGAALIGLDGRVLHEWALPYSKIWDETAEAKRPRPDEFIFWEDTHLYPNGDLLALYVGVGDTPWGLGLAKLDKNSHLIWKYLGRAHHDVEVAPNGNIYTLTHSIAKDVIPGWEVIEGPRIDDYVVVLSPDGRELKKVSVLQALLASPYARLLWRNQFNPRGDLTHANTVKPITPAMARRLPFAKPGQVLLSLREIDALVVMDLEEKRVVWAYRGPWMAQHDPEVLPNGNILLFDNFGEFKTMGPSRVIEFDPRSGLVKWSYTGDGTRPLDSAVRSGQERLPNGNTLITESDAGRILEVTREGRTVWEFTNPVRGGANRDEVPILGRAQRIDMRLLDPAVIDR